MFKTKLFQHFQQCSQNCYTCGLDRKYRVLVSVVCLSVCKHDNSKNKWSRILKFEYIVGYEKSSDEFDIGHCPIKVKVMV